MIVISSILLAWSFRAATSLSKMERFSSITSDPGPIPDESKFLGSRLADNRARALGTSTGTPSKSKQPRSPSHSLPTLQTPPTHSSVRPSTSSNQLCKAQHVNQTESTASTPCSLTPLFNILHLPFIIPNVHSTSFRIDSSHFDHLISSMLLETPNGGTVHDQSKYPLSVITYAPLNRNFTIRPFLSWANSSNRTSSRTIPSRIPEIKVSNRTIVWSFHLPGPPYVVCSIRRRWLQVKLNVLVVRLFFAPRWLFFRLYSHRSVTMWVQSDDPTHPGNPASLYSFMFDKASGKLTGVRTHFW